jgi:hypothetical protein
MLHFFASSLVAALLSLQVSAQVVSVPAFFLGFLGSILTFGLLSWLTDKPCRLHHRFVGESIDVTSQISHLLIFSDK